MLHDFFLFAEQNMGIDVCPLYSCRYMTSEEERAQNKAQEIMTATFHFCNPGRTLLTGLESVSQLGTCACVKLEQHHLISL
jgi:hypothetical protein